MKKIFGILVVLMMVAGTFVSCSRPTDVSTGAGTSVSSSIIAEGTDGNLCIVRDEHGDLYLCTKAASVFEGYYSNAGYTGIVCSVKDYLPELAKNYLYVSDNEKEDTNATFDNGGVLKITCPALPASNNTTHTIKITSTNSTLKYKIVH